MYTQSDFETRVLQPHRTPRDWIQLLAAAERPLRRIAREFIATHVTRYDRHTLYEDVMSIGLVQLEKVIEARTWDPARGPFWPYFRQVFRNQLLRYLHQLNFIELSPRAREHWRAILQKVEDLFIETGSEPTAEEVVTALAIPELEEHHVREVLVVHKQVTTLPQDEDSAAPQSPDHTEAQAQLRMEAAHLYEELGRCLDDRVLRDKWCIVSLMRAEDRHKEGVMKRIAEDLCNARAAVGKPDEDGRSPWIWMCITNGFDALLPLRWQAVYDLFRYGRGKTGHVTPRLAYVDHLEQPTETDVTAARTLSRANLRQWYVRTSARVDACRQTMSR